MLTNIRRGWKWIRVKNRFVCYEKAWNITTVKKLFNWPWVDLVKVFFGVNLLTLVYDNNSVWLSIIASTPTSPLHFQIKALVFPLTFNYTFRLSNPSLVFNYFSIILSILIIIVNWCNVRVFYLWFFSNRPVYSNQLVLLHRPFHRTWKYYWHL